MIGTHLQLHEIAVYVLDIFCNKERIVVVIFVDIDDMRAFHVFVVHVAQLVFAYVHLAGFRRLLLFHLDWILQQNELVFEHARAWCHLVRKLMFVVGLVVVVFGRLR